MGNKIKVSEWMQYFYRTTVKKNLTLQESL